MRFTDTTPTTIAPVTNRHEITPKSPLNPAHKVGPGFPETMEGLVGEEQHQAQGGAGAPHAEPPPPDVSAYQGEDRRKMCRRIHNIPVLLDTRSGEERRKHDRPGELPPTHMDDTA